MKNTPPLIEIISLNLVYHFIRINFSQLLERIGIYSDNITKGERADFGSSKHLLTDDERAEVFDYIMQMYQTFKQRVYICFCLL